MAPFKDKGSKMASVSVKESQNTHQGFSCFLNLWLEVYFSLNSGMQRRTRKRNLSILMENCSQNRNSFEGYGRVQEPGVKLKEISLGLQF